MKRQLCVTCSLLLVLFASCQPAAATETVVQNTETQTPTTATHTSLLETNTPTAIIVTDTPEPDYIIQLYELPEYGQGYKFYGIENIIINDSQGFTIITESGYSFNVEKGDESNQVLLTWQGKDDKKKTYLLELRDSKEELINFGIYQPLNDFYSGFLYEMSTGQLVFPTDFNDIDPSERVEFPKTLVTVHIEPDGQLEPVILSEHICQDILQKQEKYVSIKLSSGKILSWFGRQTCPYLEVTKIQ